MFEFNNLTEQFSTFIILAKPITMRDLSKFANKTTLTPNSVMKRSMTR